MNNWWKAPVLQGEDNDYGQYDYMIEEIPKNYAKWELDRECRWPCYECGRETHLLFRSEYFFHTLDGWDSMAHSECLRCRLKGTMHAFKWGTKRKFKRTIETCKLTVELYAVDRKHKKSLKHCYSLAKKLVR